MNLAGKLHKILQ